jgi:hypothetical protein
MSNEIIIPDLKGGPAALFRKEREAGEKFETLGEGIGSGYSVIGINGKEFYLQHRGGKHTLISPEAGDDGEHRPVPYFDFVILRQGALPSHTWYEHGYTAGSKSPPECVSTDGIAPDDGVSKPQATLCQICPRHDWKDLPNGRRGRECSDSMRLAVLPMPELIKMVIGEPITEPCLFRIPAASMSGLATLGDQMAKRFGPGDAPLCSFVCRVEFTNDKYPKFKYKVKRWLDEKEAAGVMELRKHPTAFRILGQTPDGRSLVRRQAAEPGQLAAAIGQVPPGRPQVVPARQEVIDLQPEKVEEEVKPAAKTLHAVPDADADIDALVQAMRPKPPGA